MARVLVEALVDVDRAALAGEPAALADRAGVALLGGKYTYLLVIYPCGTYS